RYDGDNVTMRIATWQKDMKVIGEYAASVGCPTPLFSACEPIYRAALSTRYGEQDTAAGCAALEQMAGVNRGAPAVAPARCVPAPLECSAEGWGSRCCEISLTNLRPPSPTLPLKGGGSTPERGRDSTHDSALRSPRRHAHRLGCAHHDGRRPRRPRRYLP